MIIFITGIEKKYKYNLTFTTQSNVMNVNSKHGCNINLKLKTVMFVRSKFVCVPLKQSKKKNVTIKQYGYLKIVFY